MKKNVIKRKKALLSLELSTFKIPPAGDILVLGKSCPIGPKAALKMLNTVAAGKFELIRPSNKVVDGVLIRKQLFLRADKKSLINAIVEDASPMMSGECMLSIKCDIAVKMTREIQG